MLVVMLVVLIALAAAAAAWIVIRARRGRGASTSGAARAARARSEISVLAGRRFRVIGADATVVWDRYIVDALGEAGLVPLPDLLPGESNGEYGHRLLRKLQSRMEVVVGALLVPERLEDWDWTPEIAAATAAFVLTLHAPQDRDELDRITLATLLDFFERGIASSLLSLSSSSSPAAVAAGGPTNDAPETGRGTPSFAL